MISPATVNLKPAVIELDVGPASKCPLWLCAVRRRHSPVGGRPTRRIALAGSNRSSHGGNEMAYMSSTESRVFSRCGPRLLEPSKPLHTRAGPSKEAVLRVPVLARLPWCGQGCAAARITCVYGSATTDCAQSGPVFLLFFSTWPSRLRSFLLTTMTTVRLIQKRKRVEARTSTGESKPQVQIGGRGSMAQAFFCR